MCIVQKHQYTSHQNANTNIDTTQTQITLVIMQLLGGHTFANAQQMPVSQCIPNIFIVNAWEWKYTRITALIWFELPHGESVSHYDA